MSKQNKTVSDADLSNAGDDFHVLWAIKKSLDLLNFDEKGLKAIYLEGIEKNDNYDLDPTGEKFLGIDLCEYFGGDTFETANSIVISQIKYSTRKANENFTFSELYEGKKSGSYKGSIIHRLASVLSPFLQKYGREQVIKKIRIKLVSNREINALHLNQITKIQNYLEENNKDIKLYKVFEDLNDISKDPFLKLQEASELNDQDFRELIQILDFNDCGADSRAGLKIALILSISKNSISTKHQFNSLFQMIWGKMQPEKRNERMVTYIDVVGEFGFPSIEYLFPVSQDFEKNENSILREQLYVILNLIDRNTSFLPICIHGGAGYGKSTIINQIKKSIPGFCECVLFDCYGTGKYENPQDKRHLHKNAIVQIANEIAKKIGSDLLLIRNESDDVYLKELIRRIEQAVAILRGRNANSYLVLIIDAADNSVSAAMNSGDKSFVQELLRIGSIEGFILIVTTRSHRKNTLNLPPNYQEFELKPFSLNETKQFLANKIQNNSEEEIEDFHKYTYGIPRVQSYSLDLKNQGINEIINYLKPNGKKVKDLILDKIELSITRLGSSSQTKVEQFFMLLISLPRPVPLKYLAELIDVKVSFLIDLAAEAWHGLILEFDFFSFRDEDFENYIKDKYQPTENKLKEIAEYFIKKAEFDEYASSNLANLLFRSQSYADLIDITINKKLLNFPIDHIRNKEVYINRVKLALQVARYQNDELTFFKLLFIAAEESKTDRVINDLVVKYPDFILKYGDEKSLYKLLLNSRESSWGGSFYLKLASINSRIPQNRELTLNYLKNAHDWLNWRSLKKDDDENARKYNISDIDIACHVEVNLRLFGIEKAMLILNSWIPIEARLGAGEHFFDNVIRNSNSEEFEKWLSYPHYNLIEKIFIVCSLFKYNRQIDFNLEEITIELINVLKNPRIKFIINFKNYIIEFCKIINLHKINESIVIEILSLIETKKPEILPSFYKGFRDDNILPFSIHFSKVVLSSIINNEEIVIENYYPDKLISIKENIEYELKESLRRDKEEIDTFYRHVLSIFTLISNIYTNKLKLTESLNQLQYLVNKLKDDHDFDYRLRHGSSDKKLFLIEKFCEAALLLAAEKVAAINYISDAFNSEKNNLRIRFLILEKIINNPDLNSTTLKLFDEQDKLIKASNLSGQEIIDCYIDCLKLSNKIDVAFSQYFLEQVISATKEIDIEAFEKIKCISSLSEIGLSDQNPKLAFEFSRFIEFSDMKLGGYDKKHFPYLSGLIGIANIDKSSVLPSLCRWHHRNIVKINEEITPVLIYLLKTEYVNHLVISSLIPIITYYYHPEEMRQIYELLNLKYNENENSSLKNKFIRTEFRYQRLDKNNYAIEKLYESIKTGKFIANELLLEIKDYLDFIENLEIKSHTQILRNTQEDENYEHELDLNSIDYTSTFGLEKSINGIILKNTEKSEKYKNRFIIKKLLFDLIEKCEPEQFTLFLSSLINVDKDLLDYYTLENVLEKCLSEWSFYPEIKKWKRDNFKFILSVRFEHFNKDTMLLIDSIRKLAQLFKINDHQLGDCIIEVLPQKLEQLSDEATYSSIDLIKNKLNSQANEELLIWVLERWNANIPKDFSDGIWVQQYTPPTNSNENVANLLRFLLGHPDKSLRWRAVHSIRRMVDLNNIEILDILLEKQNEKNCTPFQNKNFIFYWMSAKLYLWIAIERISLENQNYLIQFKDKFYQELFNNELPHVLIRKFIKKTCQNLIFYDSSIFSKTEIESINIVNVSKKKPLLIKKKNIYSRLGSNNQDDMLRFHFDPIDTLPYWYGPLGRIFNLPEHSVTQIVDKIITEQWGYVGDPNKDDFISNQLDGDDWHMTRNDHGSNPKFEDLRIYFEYHAMYCAANVLLENYPLIEDEDQCYSWEYWLNSEANEYPDFWLSDKRDSLPLRKEFWRDKVTEYNEVWRDNIEESYFDHNIGLIDKDLIVFADIDKNVGEIRERVDISSCLISNKIDEEELQKLQVIKDHYDYYLDMERINSYEREEEDKFIPWLKHNNSEFDGLDSHDPYFHNIAKWYVTFGSIVENNFEIEYDNLYKRGFLEGLEISQFENWNEISEHSYKMRKYSSVLETSGKLFRVNKEFISKLLKKENKSLLIKCVIKREVDNKRDWQIGSRENVDNRNQVKLYLIKKDGEVKTNR